MKTLSWKVWAGLAAALIVEVLCLRHIASVREPKSFFDYFVLEVAFLPLQVVLVSVIIERLLHEREKLALLKKLNTVVGAFFTEVGSKLLVRMGSFCCGFDELAPAFQVAADGKEKDFQRAILAVKTAKLRLEPSPGQLSELKQLLSTHLGFILSLLQNPNLLEHEAFTDLLWAVTHLAEELAARDDLDSLPAADLAHLSGDVARAYGLLIREWLAYMRHLKTDYPYIFSLSLRLNPFKRETTAVIN